MCVATLRVCKLSQQLKMSPVRLWPPANVRDVTRTAEQSRWKGRSFVSNCCYERRVADRRVRVGVASAFDGKHYWRKPGTIQRAFFVLQGAAAACVS